MILGGEELFPIEVDEFSKIYKMGMSEFKDSSKDGIYEFNVNLTNIINVGGGGIILKWGNRKVLKIVKMNYIDARGWNKNRENKDITELTFGEELLLGYMYC